MCIYIIHGYLPTLLHTEQPQFTRTPTDAERSVGGNVEFFCSASGDPAPRIRWLHNSSPVIQSHRVFISDEGDLALYNLSTADDGLYECQAENSAGLVRTYSRLSILGGPTVCMSFSLFIIGSLFVVGLCPSNFYGHIRD